FCIEHRNIYDINTLYKSLTHKYIESLQDHMLNESDRYQNLRSHSMKSNNYEAETRFYTLKNRCFEKSGKLDSFSYLLSRMYDNFSMYGTSPFVTLIWILFFLIIFSIPYISEPITVEGQKLNFFLTGLSTMTRPFYLLLYTKAFSNPWLQIINFIQSVVAVPLWTLFVISIRWSFRRRMN
ncbi:hypothetical protein, partial [Legionella sainthelensi]|uniref:hypothetical protein n=1 Tax=Legionella sainthelensi TaxID=28087 RepID=UPI001C6FC798